MIEGCICPLVPIAQLCCSRRILIKPVPAPVSAESSYNFLPKVDILKFHVNGIPHAVVDNSFPLWRAIQRRAATQPPEPSTLCRSHHTQYHDRITVLTSIRNKLRTRNRVLLQLVPPATLILLRILTAHRHRSRRTASHPGLSFNISDSPPCYPTEL